MTTFKFLPAFAITTITITTNIFASASSASAYNFTLIADNTGPFNLFQDNAIAINDSGTVAFRGILDNGSEGIYTGNGSNITKIADTSGQFGGFLSPKINNSGLVAFIAYLDSGLQGIYTSDGVTTTMIAGSTVNSLFGFGEPDINNKGEVSFISGRYNSGITQVVKGNGNSLTTIADTTGIYKAFVKPRINDNGTVVVSGFNANNRPAIVKIDGSNFTVIASENDPSRFFNTGRADGFSINNRGIVAFTAAPKNNNPTQREGVYTTVDGSSISAYVDVPLANDPSLSSLGVVSLNDNGLIAYTAISGGPIANNAPIKLALFAGSNLTDKVIERGDTLFGSTVADIQFYEGGLNNNGQLAFYARYADGRQVIVRADPDVQSVPEPSDVLGIVSAFGFGLFFKARTIFNLL